MPLTDDKKRDFDREWHNKKNASKREIYVPPPVSMDRRLEAEANDELWLKTYFAKAFFRPFTSQQKKISESIGWCIRERRMKAIAAPRGSGKSSIGKHLILKYTIQGIIRFTVLVGATGVDSKNLLNEIKRFLYRNKLLKEDYPEICFPIDDIARSPRKCALQTVKGQYTDIIWQKDQITFPTIEGSVCSGSKIYARSLEGSIRGLNEDSERPDFVLIDDPETRESAGSEPQRKSRRTVIDNDIGGLAIQGDSLAVLMLTTVQHVDSLSMEYTDPKRRPAYHGERWKGIERWPNRMDLWDEYILTRQEEMSNGHIDTPRANQFYIDRQRVMDNGAELANPYATNNCTTALQNMFNTIADKGMNFVLTEVNNEPPDPRDIETSHIVPQTILNHRNHLEHRISPQDAYGLTASIDIGKYSCHWQVNSWIKGDVGQVIDYGVVEVYGTSKNNNDKQQVDDAILNALRRFREMIRNEHYCDESGEVRPISVCVVDSSEFTDAVYEFVLESGLPFIASKGIGDNYKQGTPSENRYVGNHYYAQPIVHAGRHPGIVRLYHPDTNHWKQIVHDAWMLPTFNEDGSWRAGALSIFHASEKSRHHSFAKHICAEKYEEEFIEGKGMRRGWKKLSSNNHWLDTCYMQMVAREILKADIIERKKKEMKPSVKPAVSNPARSPWEV